MSVNKSPTGPLSWRLVFVLCLCDGAHYYAICSLFSYAGIMSADLNWVDSRDHAGFVAGFLASAGMIGRTLTSSLWGSAAARYGYKKVLISILCSIALGGIVFGLSTNLLLSFGSRLLLLGCGNGWVTLMAPLALEVGGAERQADVMGMIMGSGSFTQLFGPAVAGCTYGLLPGFPAAVPSMIGTIYALLTLLGIVLWMPASIGVYSVLSLEDPAGGSPSKSKPDKVSSWKLMFRWPVGLIACMRFLHGAMTMGFMEIAPLWLISTISLGGLALSQQEVGTFLARSAIWNMIYFSIILPRGSKLLGGKCFAGIVSAIAASCCIALPFTTRTITANLIHMVGFTTSVSTGAMAAIFTNNSVSQERLSEINGMIVIFETLGKAIGPIVIANAFAWTLSCWGRAGHSLVFLILALMHTLYLVGVMCLPASVEIPFQQHPTPVHHTKDGKLTLPTVLGAAKIDVADMNKQDKPVDSLETCET